MPLAAFREQPKGRRVLYKVRVADPKAHQVLGLAEAPNRDAAEGATVWTLGLTKEQRGRLVAQERE